MKHLLVENELKKLKTFDSSYFRQKDYLQEDYLILKTMDKYFKKIANTKSIFKSDDVIKSPAINDNILAPELDSILIKKYL